MKFLACFFILAVFLFLEQTHAQCPNAPRVYTCTPPADSGRSGSNCSAGTRWYYSTVTRSCTSFHYNGCGGNANRYCSLSACQQRCIRSG